LRTPLAPTPAVLATTLLTALACAAPAAAVVSPATMVDGPSADIVDFGGVAMAEDGTGGVVYRKRVDGRIRIFAAQFAGGVLRAPQRVDFGQRFDSSWPAIGAGDGGRLVVTWVQENGVETDRMFSAQIDPGAQRFTAPVPVDMNVGEATDTWPSMAMSRGGQAYLTYRVCKDPERNPSLPPGTAECELRLARYTGQLWSPLGFPLNRNAASPVRRPNADNAPRVAIDPSGSAVIAWQEPDDDFIDRVWARRVFGATVGLPLLVSPQKIGETPLRGGADQPALDIAGFGQATIAFRQRGQRSGPQVGTRLWAATIPETFVQEAARPLPARVIDGLEADPPVEPGRASVAGAPAGAFIAAFGVGAESLLVSGDEQAVGKPERLDQGDTTEPGEPQLDLAPSGALAAAFRRRVGGRTQITLVERRADGVPDSRSVNTERGGAIVRFALAGSGLGDALVGFQQGTAAGAQIAAAFVDAPPGAFTVQTPADFTRRTGEYRLVWERAPTAISGVRYAVIVDDEEVASDLGRTRSQLDLDELDDGVHAVQIIARDGAGQETSSAPGSLKLDREAPTVAVQRRAGRRVRVVVSDGEAGEVAGADHAATRILWGDGRSAAGREEAFAVTHRYPRAGRFRIVVRVRDVLGNTRSVERTVRVR
jgi:hypothetical protein